MYGNKCARIAWVWDNTEFQLTRLRCRLSEDREFYLYVIHIFDILSCRYYLIRLSGKYQYSIVGIISITLDIRRCVSNFVGIRKSSRPAFGYRTYVLIEVVCNLRITYRLRQTVGVEHISRPTAICSTARAHGFDSHLIIGIRHKTAERISRIGKRPTCPSYVGSSSVLKHPRCLVATFPPMYPSRIGSDSIQYYIRRWIAVESNDRDIIDRHSRSSRLQVGIYPHKYKLLSRTGKRRRQCILECSPI